MGFRDLPAEEVSAVLASERVIRVAFDDGEERYLIPLFYVWHEGALHGLTTPGRKTAMASARPALPSRSIPARERASSPGRA